MTVRLQRWIAVLAAGAMCACAHGASFDCKLAKTEVEKAVCANKELSADDVELAAAYKRALAMAPADIQEDIRTNQRAWLGRGREWCASIANAAKTTQQGQMVLVTCLNRTYKSQTLVMERWVMERDGIVFVQRSTTEKAKSDPVSPWRDSSGDPNPGYGTLAKMWPQALSDAPEWKAWNSAVQSATDGMASVDGDVDYDVTATIDAVTPEMVAMSIEDDWYGHGAAHPNENSVQLNWMRKERRELQAQDVFRDGTEWARFIEERCRASMRAGVGEDYESFLGKAKFAEVLHGIVAHPANWQLNSEGVTIVFQDYELEAHAFRPENVTVPWRALQRFLNPGFAIPR